MFRNIRHRDLLQSDTDFPRPAEWTNSSPSEMASALTSRHCVGGLWKITILPRHLARAACRPHHHQPWGWACQQLHLGDLVEGSASFKPWENGSTPLLGIQRPHIKRTCVCQRALRVIHCLDVGCFATSGPITCFFLSSAYQEYHAHVLGAEPILYLFQIYPDLVTVILTCQLSATRLAATKLCHNVIGCGPENI